MTFFFLKKIFHIESEITYLLVAVTKKLQLIVNII